LSRARAAEVPTPEATQDEDVNHGCVRMALRKNRRHNTTIFDFCQCCLYLNENYLYNNVYNYFLSNTSLFAYERNDLKIKGDRKIANFIYL
jgi:hypothetical protein